MLWTKGEWVASCSVIMALLFTPVSITLLIDTEDACFDLNASRPIAKGDLKWRDALLVAHRVNSNIMADNVIKKNSSETLDCQSAV